MLDSRYYCLFEQVVCGDRLSIRTNTELSELRLLKTLFDWERPWRHLASFCWYAHFNKLILALTSFTQL